MTDDTFRVVRNHEEQYAIWPAELPAPPGWSDEGTTGGRDACLEHIARVWTDIRPLGLRTAVAERRSGRTGGDAAPF